MYTVYSTSCPYQLLLGFTASKLSLLDANLRSWMFTDLSFAFTVINLVFKPLINAVSESADLLLVTGLRILSLQLWRTKAAASTSIRKNINLYVFIIYCCLWDYFNEL